MTGKDKENFNKEYIALVNNLAPKTKEAKSLFFAFLVGGFICIIGQAIRYFLMFKFNLYGDKLASSTSTILIFLGCFLTGLGVYDRIGHVAGGGSIVPITGFANSVTSPAMEFKSEGYIYGMGAKMFVVAGPIIVFGVTASVATGFVYYLIGLFV